MSGSRSSGRSSANNSDPYRKLFLDHVKVILNKPSSKEALLELMQCSWPGFTEQQLLTPTTRGKGLRKLLRRVGPEKEIAESIQQFYDSSVERIKSDAAAAAAASNTGSSKTEDGGDNTNNKRRKTQHSTTSTAPYMDSERVQDETDMQYFCVLSHGFPTTDPVEFNEHFYERNLLQKYVESTQTNENSNGVVTILDPASRTPVEVATLLSALDVPKDDRLRQRIHAAETSYHGRNERRQQDATRRRQAMLPDEFLISEKYSYLNIATLQPIQETIEVSRVPALAAAYCINARGTIVHGKEPELTYGVEQLLMAPSSPRASVDDSKWTLRIRRTDPRPAGSGDKTEAEHSPPTEGDLPASVEGIFNRFGEGFKVLDSIETIQEEIMKHGPVVSTSFVLSEQILKSNDNMYASSFVADRVNQIHELVIVGWKLTNCTQVWICKCPLQTMNSPATIEIAFRQFGIDDIALAPKGDFKNKSWQKGPYFSTKFGNSAKEEWRNWQNMATHVNESGLVALFKCFDGEGVGRAIQSKKRFTIRDHSERADSRSCTLKEVSWVASRSQWKIQVDFVD